MHTEIQNITHNDGDMHEEEPDGELDETVLESQGITVDKSHLDQGRRNGNDNNNEGQDGEDEVIADGRGTLHQSQLENETIQHLNNFSQQLREQMDVQEAFRQQIEREAANLPTDPAALQAIQRQIEEAAMAATGSIIDASGVDVQNAQTPPSGNKRRKSDKGEQPQLNTCLAANCDRQIKQRRLCPMHQKQKERSGGKLELKENVKFSKGRTPTPFSKHANKYAKLKSFDKKIDEWAGGQEEGSMMLEYYIESSYYQARFPKQEDSKIFEQIGKNIIEFMKQLPDKSPLRRPLIKAVSENVPLARLREVLPVSKQTVINSKKLPDQENLLLTIKYKPNVTRNRKHLLDAMGQPILGATDENGNLINGVQVEELPTTSDDLNNAQHIMETFTNNNNSHQQLSQLAPLNQISQLAPSEQMS